MWGHRPDDVEAFRGPVELVRSGHPQALNGGSVGSMTVCLFEICCDAPGCQAGIGHGPTRPGMKLEALGGEIKKLLEAHAWTWDSQGLEFCPTHSG
jgi:hypothetical protein